MPIQNVPLAEEDRTPGENAGDTQGLMANSEIVDVYEPHDGFNPTWAYELPLSFACIAAAELHLPASGAIFPNVLEGAVSS